jgi:NAD(P)H-hydrate repair Nnr-like enzyme with NAD(P)H-hydrate epimerase domain
LAGLEEPLTVPVRSTVVVALLGALLLAVSGCGDTVIDDVKTAEATKASLEKSLHEKIKSVDCPSGVKVEAGKTFTCTVDLPGEEATATLKIRNSDADVSLVGLKPKANAGKANE